KKGGRRIEGEAVPSQPLVTVITVVLNGEKHLAQTIQSVQEQSFGNIEYIIIDGVSTDSSLEIIKEHEDRIDYWISEPDQGIYDAMNKGIALARGKLIGLLNAGDHYEQEAIAAVVAAYLRHGAPGIYFGHTYLLQEDLGLRYRYPARLDHWRGMGFCHPAMFAHRQVYHDLGKYDLAYRFAADYDFLLRALRHQVELIPVDAYLVNYRNNGLSATNLADSLSEIKTINRNHFGFFSSEHFKFLVLYAKSMLLISLQPLIRRIAGEKYLTVLKSLYTRMFLAKIR
ncbi:MAG: glycosyltransferase family 2 protein, partial [Deltaproteobacteria bacterium]